MTTVKHYKSYEFAYKLVEYLRKNLSSLQNNEALTVYAYGWADNSFQICFRDKNFKEDDSLHLGELKQVLSQFNEVIQNKNWYCVSHMLEEDIHLSRCEDHLYLKLPIILKFEYII